MLFAGLIGVFLIVLTVLASILETATWYSVKDRTLLVIVGVGSALGVSVTGDGVVWVWEVSLTTGWLLLAIKK